MGAVLLAAASGADTVLVHQGTSYRIKEKRLKGKRYFHLPSITNAFGSSVAVHGRRRKTVTVQIQSRTATMSVGKSLASVDGIVMDLKAPVEEIQKDIYVPESFMTLALSRLADAKVVYVPDTDSFVVSSGKSIDVSIDFRSFPDHTRIVLRASERVPFTVMHPPGRIILRLNAQGIRCAVDELPIGDGAVKDITFKEGSERGTFVIGLDSAFKDFRTTDFQEPFRIMLDIARLGRYTPEGAPQVVPKTTPPPDVTGFAIPTPPPYPDRQPKPFRTVVLDPGHGGKEVGARGPSGLLEKDVTLEVAQVLKRMLEANLGLEVLLTRQTDVEMSLQERTAVANYNKANLFLSIHCNASPRKNARGAETYFMSYQASDDDAGRLARYENDPSGRAGSEEPLSDLELILWDMAQTEYIKESEQFAEACNYELSETLGIHDRGVKQAPFAVLAGAAMPAVLVEIAFISNPVEERALRSSEFKVKIATALYKSILRFKNSYELKRGLYGR